MCSSSFTLQHCQGRTGRCIYVALYNKSVVTARLGCGDPEHMFNAVLFAAAGIPTGSGKPKTEKVGKVTKAQVEVRHAF